MAKFIGFFKFYLLPIVSGILIGTSYIPFPPWASLFAFVPLWLFFQKQTALRPILTASFITGFLLTLIGFNWVAHTLREFGHLPWPAAIGALIGFCAIANLDILFASWAWWEIKKRIHLSSLQSLAALALLTAFFERHFPTIFAWNYGFTFLWADLPISQLAEFIGFQGLSTLVILSSGALTWAWLSSSRALRIRSVAAVAVVFLGLNGLGLLVRSSLAAPDAKLKVLITQANIGNQEKQYAEQGARFREHIINRYVSLAREALEASSGPIDFMVWPETALPVEVTNPNYFHPVLEPVRNLVNQYSTPLITGGYGFDEKSRKTTNSFFIFEKDGNMQWPFYFKTILLVFGEYIPFSDSFPAMKNWFPAGDFATGPGPQVQTLNGLKIGPQICYESLFPDFSRGLVKQGAQVIVNITNDSWYGEWQEPYQHGYMTLARAIEFRRPLIRSTNTGISTVALADGKILKKSPMGQEWTNVYEVPYIKTPALTLYAKIPWLIDVLLIIVLLIILRAGWMRGSNAEK